MNERFPVRKVLRLKEYDYGMNGAYFVALCTKERKMLFSPVGADIESAPTVPKILQSFKRYSTVEYIKMVKQGVLPPFDGQIWQRSYHDHVIRNQQDYDEVYRYIEENSLRWQLDDYYIEG